MYVPEFDFVPEFDLSPSSGASRHLLPEGEVPIEGSRLMLASYLFPGRHVEIIPLVMTRLE